MRLIESFQALKWSSFFCNIFSNINNQGDLEKTRRKKKKERKHQKAKAIFLKWNWLEYSYP